MARERRHPVGEFPIVLWLPAGCRRSQASPWRAPFYSAQAWGDLEPPCVGRACAPRAPLASFTSNRRARSDAPYHNCRARIVWPEGPGSSNIRALAVAAAEAVPNSTKLEELILPGLGGLESDLLKLFRN